MKVWNLCWWKQGVMNLVATHHNCTSPLDYISHHALHTHIPVHHYTNYTAVTIHSLVLIASPHLHLILTLTYKQHTYTHPLLSLVFPWLTFPSVFLVVFPCTTWTVDFLSWSFAACLSDLACLLVILSVCRLPWPIALPLISTLPCLRCPRYLCLMFDLVLIKLLLDLLSPLTCHSLHKEWILHLKCKLINFLHTKQLYGMSLSQSCCFSEGWQLWFGCRFFGKIIQIKALTLDN